VTIDLFKELDSDVR